MASVPELSVAVEVPGSVGGILGGVGGKWAPSVECDVAVIGMVVGTAAVGN